MYLKMNFGWSKCYYCWIRYALECFPRNIICISSSESIHSACRLGVLFCFPNSDVCSCQCLGDLWLVFQAGKYL